MIIVFIIVSVILLLVMWVVFVPLIIRVDTTTDRYEVYQPGTFRLMVVPFRENFLNLRVLGFRINLHPNRDTKPKPEIEKVRKKKNRKSTQAIRYLIQRIPRCITLKYLRGSFDLDNVIWNANLMPVGYLISNGPVNVSTNFYGQTYLKLRIDFRLYRMVWTFIRFLTKK